MENQNIKKKAKEPGKFYKNKMTSDIEFITAPGKYQIYSKLESINQSLKEQNNPNCYQKSPKTKENNSITKYNRMQNK